MNQAKGSEGKDSNGKFFLIKFTSNNNLTSSLEQLVRKTVRIIIYVLTVLLLLFDIFLSAKF